MKTVYLSLGSNLGDRARQIQRAVDLLAASDVKLLRVSPVYETEPQGGPDQRLYLNIVLEVQTLLFPLQLLARTQSIETKLKRKRTILDGPRTIDIDIILFGDLVVKTPELEIPHARYAQRRFVLTPLADLAPELIDPVTHRTVQSLLAEVEGQGLKPSTRTIKLH